MSAIDAEAIVPTWACVCLAGRADRGTSSDVRTHFAELYSSQTAVADQLSQWKTAGEPGSPMVNFGESATTASTIASVTAQTCAEVADKKWWGLYVYPTALDGGRLAAMVKALNACTAR